MVEQVKLLDADKVLAKLHEAGMDDLTRKYVTNQMDRGLLPFTKVGNVRRVRSDVVDHFIKEKLEDAL